ncbi:MAG: glycosyltransferase family 39 protein [Candidatus Beckwithbacteria bacterium]|nr:glycosyltransferase family 39 protein [Candidatus Beckwithbacteria bacterium]
MKQLQFIKSEKFWLWLIFILGIALRFYKLGKVPSGFVNDEADFGYNAYSLIKTGKDEFGKSWPLIFQSFGDGKMPVYFYLTIPSVLIFGLTEFAVRFPSALFGSLTVLLVYFLAKNFARHPSPFALIASLVLATMPWHIHFSRAAFEANVGLFWLVLGSIFFFRFVKSSKAGQLIVSLTALTLSVFSYHAPRLFIPVWLIYLIWQYRRQLPIKKTIIHTLIIVFIPWLILNFSKASLTRSAGISIFNAQSGVSQRLQQKFIETRNQPLWLTRAFHNKPVEFTVDFIRRYASHFDSNFLFFNGDPIRPRYRVPDTGQALWFTLPFFFLGLYFLVKNKHWPILVWLLLAPLPAAITFETPSAIRAILMIIPLSLAIALGASETIKRFPYLRFLLLLIFGFNFFSYLDAYFVHAPIHQPYEWQGGYKELVKRVNEMMPNYDKALITDSRGTAYIYFLFYNQYDPVKWQAQANESITAPDKFGFSTINKVDNLYFIGERCPTKIAEDKVLYVCNIAIEEDRPKIGFTQFKDMILFDDGQPAFVLFEKENLIQ